MASGPAGGADGDRERAGELTALPQRRRRVWATKAPMKRHVEKAPSALHLLDRRWESEDAAFSLEARELAGRIGDGWSDHYRTLRGLPMHDALPACCSCPV